MSGSPNIDALGDPDMGILYDAEFDAHRLLPDCYVSPADVPSFARTTLDVAGWASYDSPTFQMEADTADDGRWAGWVERETGIIYLNPRELTLWTVLHEMAHWIDSSDHLHGRRFRRDHARLVGAGLGDHARETLVFVYEANELPLEPG
jgi:hypothetical protein